MSNAAVSPKYMHPRRFIRGNRMHCEKFGWENILYVCPAHVFLLEKNVAKMWVVYISGAAPINIFDGFGSTAA